MSSIRLHRPSPALVVATIALIVALSGTAYAGIKLSRGSVGNKQIKNGAVTSKKIKNGAVTNTKIANGAVTGPKVKLSTLGTVPTANHANSASTASTANSASTAGNAASVDGATLTTLSDALPEGTTRTIFSGEGLTLVATCTGTGRLGLTGQSSDPRAELNDFGNDGGTAFAQDRNSLGASTDNILNSASDHEGNVTITYGSTTGHEVTATLGTDFSNAFATASQCGIWGTIAAG